MRDQRIGVLANGPRSVHQALLFRQLSDHVTYFTNATPLTDEEAEQLDARGIAASTRAIDALEVTDDRLTGVRLDDGTVIGVDAFALMPHMVARAGFLVDLGLRLVPHPSGIGDHIPVDATGRTTVPGVWAAGNVTDIAAQVGASSSRSRSVRSTADQRRSRRRRHDRGGCALQGSGLTRRRPNRPLASQHRDAAREDEEHEQPESDEVEHEAEVADDAAESETLYEKANGGDDGEIAEPSRQRRSRSTRSPAASMKTLPKTSPRLLIANVSRYSMYDKPGSFCAAYDAIFPPTRPVIATSLNAWQATMRTAPTSTNIAIVRPSCGSPRR